MPILHFVLKNNDYKEVRKGGGNFRAESSISKFLKTFGNLWRRKGKECLVIFENLSNFFDNLR